MSDVIHARAGCLTALCGAAKPNKVTSGNKANCARCLILQAVEQTEVDPRQLSFTEDLTP